MFFFVDFFLSISFFNIGLIENCVFNVFFNFFFSNIELIFNWELVLFFNYYFFRFLISFFMFVFLIRFL